MESAFRSLELAGQNNVDGVVSMMRSAGLLGSGGDIEQYIRSLFGEGPELVQYDQFQGVMARIAQTLGMQVENFGDQLIAAAMFQRSSAHNTIEESPSQIDNQSSESMEGYSQGGLEGDETIGIEDTPAGNDDDE